MEYARSPWRDCERSPGCRPRARSCRQACICVVNLERQRDAGAVAALDGRASFIGNAKVGDRRQPKFYKPIIGKGDGQLQGLPVELHSFLPLLSSRGWYWWQ